MSGLVLSNHPHHHAQHRDQHTSSAAVTTSNTCDPDQGSDTGGGSSVGSDEDLQRPQQRVEARFTQQQKKKQQQQQQRQQQSPEPELSQHTTLSYHASRALLAAPAANTVNTNQSAGDAAAVVREAAPRLNATITRQNSQGQKGISQYNRLNTPSTAARPPGQSSITPKATVPITPKIPVPITPKVASVSAPAVAVPLATSSKSAVPPTADKRTVSNAEGEESSDDFESLLEGRLVAQLGLIGGSVHPPHVPPLAMNKLNQRRSPVPAVPTAAAVAKQNGGSGAAAAAAAAAVAAAAAAAVAAEEAEAARALDVPVPPKVVQRVRISLDAAAAARMTPGSVFVTPAGPDRIKGGGASAQQAARTSNSSSGAGSLRLSKGTGVGLSVNDRSTDKVCAEEACAYSPIFGRSCMFATW